MLNKLSGLMITKVACALPKDNPSVCDYANGLITEKEAKRIARGTGFERLRISPDNVTTADLCMAAADVLFNEDKCLCNEIDAVIFVTQTPDYYLPATSHIIQNRLGLKKETLCFDINEGCAGYVNGMYLSALLVSSKQCKKVLLLAGDTISKITTPNDRATRCIFGDAGTATVIETGIDDIAFNIQSYGDRYETIIVENSRHRINLTDEQSGYLQLDGMGIMNFTLNEVPENIGEILKFMHIDKRDISLYACHQANRLILNSLAEKLGVDYDKVPFTANNIGNTSSASIPLLLQGIDKDRLKKVLFCGFGVGLTIGSCIINLTKTKFSELVEI